jgi:hypothetical protein
MAELESPNSNAAEPTEAKAAAGRTKDEVALDLMKFIAVNTGYGKGGQSGAGFSAKQVNKTPEEHADALLELFRRCRRAVGKDA